MVANLLFVLKFGSILWTARDGLTRTGAIRGPTRSHRTGCPIMGLTTPLKGSVRNFVLKVMRVMSWPTVGCLGGSGNRCLSWPDCWCLGGALLSKWNFLDSNFKTNNKFAIKTLPSKQKCSPVYQTESYQTRQDRNMGWHVVIPGGLDFWWLLVTSADFC